MQPWWLPVVAVLWGSLPWGPWLTRAAGGTTDLRKAGSGSIGATNVARVYGWKLAVPVLLLDASKGALPVALGMGFGADTRTIGLSLVLAVWAHCYTPWLGFKGGKGVATGAGGIVVWTPLLGLVAMGVWAVFLALFKRSSLGSLMGTLAMVVGAIFTQPDKLPWLVLIAVIIAWRHRGNVRRLVAGTEDRVDRF